MYTTLIGEIGPDPVVLRCLLAAVNEGIVLIEQGRSAFDTVFAEHYAGGRTVFSDIGDIAKTLPPSTIREMPRVVWPDICNIRIRTHYVGREVEDCENAWVWLSGELPILRDSIESVLLSL